MSDYKNILKFLFLFREPEKKEEFIRKEKGTEKSGKEKTSDKKRNGF